MLLTHILALRLRRAVLVRPELFSPGSPLSSIARPRPAMPGEAQSRLQPDGGKSVQTCAPSRMPREQCRDFHIESFSFPIWPSAPSSTWEDLNESGFTRRGGR